jgi:dihydroorotase/N-acyl-D-amino-acid deacylase
LDSAKTRILIGIVIGVALAAGLCFSQEPVYDVIFAGGRVIDGTGAPWFRADVGIIGDRIAAVGDLSKARVGRRIDASNLVIAPGFIDMMGQSEYRLLVDNRAASKITQGITTEITGEGSSIAPLDQRMIKDGRDVWKRYGVVPGWTTLAGYWKALRKARPAVNLGTFVGAGGVRDLVIGRENRPARPEELEAMKAAVARAMEDGALGLSTALIYVPDRFASTEEIIALAKVAASYGGSYITHQRDEGNDGNGGLDASLDEVFRIAREAGIPAEIYHLKTAGKKNWGRMPAVLARLETARAQGLDVSADQYPWAASSNGLVDSLPAWLQEGGQAKLLARLRDSAARARARRDFLTANPDWPDGASRILITSVFDPSLKKYEGRTIAEIARDEGKDPLEALMDLVLADRGSTDRVTFGMSEEDVQAALKDRLVSMCTDSPAAAEDGIFSLEKSHPRAWATTARILGHYVHDLKLMPLEEAVRKMTSLPASRMRLRDRGIVRPGLAADITAFNPDTVRARSTYADPNHYSEGFEYVMVNGELVIDGGRITDARPGRPLLGPGARPGLSREIEKPAR